MFLNVNEIFFSIDGEVNYWGQGRLTVFLRLSGCNLRCPYCDSIRTWKPGTNISIQDVVNKVNSFGVRNLTITGGEPLLQKEALLEFLVLLDKQLVQGYRVNIETNGTLPKLDFSGCSKKQRLNDNLCYTIDYKQEVDNYVFARSNFDLELKDTVKFVLQNRQQYERAVVMVKTVFNGKAVAFSPVHDDLHPKQLINWMKQDKLDNVLLNCQLHKYLQVQ